MLCGPGDKAVRMHAAALKQSAGGLELARRTMQHTWPHSDALEEAFQGARLQQGFRQLVQPMIASQLELVPQPVLPAGQRDSQKTGAE